MRNKEVFDISSVGYVKRIVIGNNNPEKATDERTIQKQIDLLNRCLTEYPKGKIIGIERNFFILNIGEQQVVMQYSVYHLGFKRKPNYL